MSHATVMVLGPETEEELHEALAPFNEELEVDEYFSPISDYVLDKQADDESAEQFAARISAEWDEKYFVQDGVVGSMSTYNPQAKWDWYSVGGRWQGSLPLKPGGEGSLGEAGVFDNEPMFEGGVDVARLGDIDFDLKRSNAQSRATATWEQVMEALDGEFLPPLPEERSREGYQAWWRHPTIERITAVLGHAFGMAAEDLVQLVEDKDRTVKRAGDDAVLCFATLHGGEWIEPGRMGWFGMSTDSGEDRDVYATRVNALLSQLPDETMIWIVDYHI